MLSRLTAVAVQQHHHHHRCDAPCARRLEAVRQFATLSQAGACFEPGWLKCTACCWTLQLWADTLRLDEGGVWMQAGPCWWEDRGEERDLLCVSTWCACCWNRGVAICHLVASGAGTIMLFLCKSMNSGLGLWTQFGAGRLVLKGLVYPA